MNSSEEQGLYKLKANCVGKLDKALKSAIENINVIIKHLTIEYDSKMNFHVNLKTLYELRKEYNAKIKEFEEIIIDLNNMYKKALVILRQCDTLPNKEFNDILNSIKTDSFKRIPVGIKNGTLLKWKKEYAEVSDKDIKNMKSRINNLSNMALKRLNEAKKLHQKMIEYRKNLYIERVLDKVNDKTSKKEVLDAVNNCDESCYKLELDGKKSNKLYQQYKQIFENYDGRELSLDVLEYLEKHIMDVISLDYRYFLDEPSGYEMFLKNYDEEKIRKNATKYNRIKSKLKLELLRDIPVLYSELQTIDGLNNRKTNILPKITKDTSISDIYDIYNKLSTNLSDGKNKFINDSYIYILGFYCSNNILNKLPNEVYLAYNRYLMDSSNIGDCLLIIKRELFKCYYDAYYDVNNDNYMDKARELLLGKIEYMFNLYSTYEAPITGEIQDMYVGRNKMDIIGLYDLYQKLNNINVFNDEKEVKFAR